MYLQNHPPCNNVSTEGSLCSLSPKFESSPPKSISSRSTPPLQLELPPVPEEDVCDYSSALSPGSSRPVQAPAGQEERAWKEKLPEKSCSDMPNSESEAISRAARGGGDAPFVPGSNLFVHFELGFISFQALLKVQLLLQLHSLLMLRASLPQVLMTQRKHPGSWLKGGERPD